MCIRKIGGSIALAPGELQEMNNVMPAGQRLRTAVEIEKPLQVVGAVNAYCAMLADREGFSCLYLSGAGVANTSFGLPDLGLTSLNDVCEDVRRITSATRLPLLVDADTGWGIGVQHRTHHLSVSRRRCCGHAFGGSGSG